MQEGIGSPVHMQEVESGWGYLESTKGCISCLRFAFKTVWPSGLRRWLKAPFRKGVGSNPTAVIRYDLRHPMHMCWHMEGGPHGLVNRRDNVQGDLCSQCSKSGDLRWDKKACVTATAQFVP